MMARVGYWFEGGGETNDASEKDAVMKKDNRDCEFQLDLRRSPS